MIAQAQVTARNVGVLLGQRNLHIFSGLLFAALVPRIMGPDIYGRYALVTSISIWFIVFSDLGFTQAASRYVPVFVFQKDFSGLQTFFWNLLTAGLITGGAASGLFLLVGGVWLKDFDVLFLGSVAGAVLLRAGNQLLYILFLGLNQAGRWGMEDILRRWLLMTFLIPGFYLGGLRGVGLGLLLTEFIVLCVGAWWARKYLSWSAFCLSFRRLFPYLQFGLSFFASNLLLLAFHFSGEPLVQLVSGDYAQVGYYKLARDVYQTAGLTVAQVTLAFAPLINTLFAEKRWDAMTLSIEKLLKVLAVAGMLVIFGAFLLGQDLVPVVLGSVFRPVSNNLLPLVLTLVLLPLSGAAYLLAMAYKKPGVALAAAGIQLLSFWGFGIPLIRWKGSMGACIAVLIATMLHTGYYTWRMRKVTRYPLRRFTFMVAAGGGFLPLIYLKSSWVVNILLFAGFIAAYGGLLFFSRLVTPEEIAAVWRALRGRAPDPNPFTGAVMK